MRIDKDDENKTREEYIEALKEADSGKYQKLQNFMFAKEDII